MTRATLSSATHFALPLKLRHMMRTESRNSPPGEPPGSRSRLRSGDADIEGLPADAMTGQSFPFIVTTPFQKGIQNRSRHIRSFVARKKSRRNAGCHPPPRFRQGYGERKAAEREQALVASLRFFGPILPPPPLSESMQPYMLHEAFRCPSSYPHSPCPLTLLSHRIR